MLIGGLTYKNNVFRLERRRLANIFIVNVAVHQPTIKSGLVEVRIGQIVAFLVLMSAKSFP